jgi:hypothetical protein
MTAQSEEMKQHAMTPDECAPRVAASALLELARPRPRAPFVVSPLAAVINGPPRSKVCAALDAPRDGCPFVMGRVFLGPVHDALQQGACGRRQRVLGQPKLYEVQLVLVNFEGSVACRRVIPRVRDCPCKFSDLETIIFADKNELIDFVL